MRSLKLDWIINEEKMSKELYETGRIRGQVYNSWWNVEYIRRMAKWFYINNEDIDEYECADMVYEWFESKFKDKCLYIGNDELETIYSVKKWVENDYGDKVQKEINMHLTFKEIILDVCEKVSFRYMKYVSIPAIKVSRNEMNKINEIENITKRKIMFTLLVWSKILHIKYNDIYIRREFINHLFRVANVSIFGTDMSLTIKELCDMGYIKLSERERRINIPWAEFDDDIDVVFETTSFDNLGWQLDLFDGKKLKVKKCECCGEYFQYKSNRSKYCEPCKKLIVKEQAKQRKRKQRAKVSSEN